MRPYNRPREAWKHSLWLLRDLAALIGIALSCWPLMIMVISSGRRAMSGRSISPRIYDCLMQMLPIGQAKLRFALRRQACRALAWNPRAIALEQIFPITQWSGFGPRFEACRASMMDLGCAATICLNEQRRLHRIRRRVDANSVRVAHASTDAALRAAATHEPDAVSRRSSLALMLSRPRGGRPSKHERVLTRIHEPAKPNRPHLSAPARLR